MRCHGCKLLQFGLRLAGRFQNLFDCIWPKKWLGSALMVIQKLDSQQNIIHWSHIKIMEWFSSNRWGVMAAKYFSLGWLVGYFQTFDQIKPKNWLGLAQMVHQQLVSYQNITHWSHSHIKMMEWSSSNRWGVMAAKCFILCSDWLDVSKLLTRSGPKTDLAWHRCSTRSWFHSKASLIGHTPRAWNGSAATDEV